MPTKQTWIGKLQIKDFFFFGGKISYQNDFADGFYNYNWWNIKKIRTLTNQRNYQ